MQAIPSVTSFEWLWQVVSRACSLRAESDLIVVGQCRIDYMPMFGFDSIHVMRNMGGGGGW